MNYFKQEDRDYYTLVLVSSIVLISVGLVLTLLEI